MARNTFYTAILLIATLSSCKPAAQQSGASASSAEASGQHCVSSVWVADQGDGTYINPVLYADYSDPDVIRVGDDFYMTASSSYSLDGKEYADLSGSFAARQGKWIGAKVGLFSAQPAGLSRGWTDVDWFHID